MSSNAMTIEGKTVLVTGANRGLGRRGRRSPPEGREAGVCSVAPPDRPPG